MHHNSANPTADGSSSASLRSEFPSYGDWLFGQTDEALADLLSRLLASNPTTFVENLTGSNAALDNLSAAVSTPAQPPRGVVRGFPRSGATPPEFP